MYSVKVNPDGSELAVDKTQAFYHENMAPKVGVTPAHEALVKLLTLPDGSVHVISSVADPVVIAGTAYESKAEDTRPNDAAAYSALDVVSNAVQGATVLEFANIGPPGGKVLIIFNSLEIRVAAIPGGMTTFRGHLYDSLPTAIGDNAAYNLSAADRDKHVGFFETGTMLDLGDTLKAQNDRERLEVKLAAGSTSLWCIPQTVGAFTPSALTFKKWTLRSVGLES